MPNQLSTRTTQHGKPSLHSLSERTYAPCWGRRQQSNMTCHGGFRCALCAMRRGRHARPRRVEWVKGGRANSEPSQDPVAWHDGPFRSRTHPGRRLHLERSKPPASELGRTDSQQEGVPAPAQIPMNATMASLPGLAGRKERGKLARRRFIGGSPVERDRACLHLRLHLRLQPLGGLPSAWPAPPVPPNKGTSRAHRAGRPPLGRPAPRSS